MQNHDITEPDAQQTFRLMHYFAVDGKEFPPGYPRVNASHYHPFLESTHSMHDESSLLHSIHHQQAPGAKQVQPGMTSASGLTQSPATWSQLMWFAMI
jgi:hypothetical protein